MTFIVEIFFSSLHVYHLLNIPFKIFKENKNKLLFKIKVTVFFLIYCSDILLKKIAE